LAEPGLHTSPEWAYGIEPWGNVTDIPIMRPSFIGIGAQRAGTTWVHNCLSEHPQVWVPQAKELHFFHAHYDRGVQWYEEQLRPPLGLHPRAVGEVTPNYFDRPTAAQRIAQVVPDAKLFVILRDPVERAYSAYKIFRYRYGSLDFQAACNGCKDLKNVGRYAKHLARFYEYFPREQVRVFLYEQIRAEPQKFLRKLYEYIGVDPTFEPPSTQITYNRVVLPHMQKLLGAAGLGWTIKAVKATPLGRWIKRRRSGGATTSLCQVDPALQPQFQAVRRHFEDDINQLESLLQANLSLWCCGKSS